MSRPCLPNPLTSLLAILLLATGLAGAQQEAPPYPKTVPREHSAPGPWGKLEYFEIHLEPPTRHVIDSGYLLSTPEWWFPNQTQAQIAAVLGDAGLTVAQIQILTQPERQKMFGNAILISPPSELVQSLPREVRGRLYSKLGEWAENRFFAKPFSLGGETILSLAASSRHSLPIEVLEFANSMIYQQGSENAFSDYPLVIRRLPDDASRIEFAKVILRVRSKMARLLLPAPANSESLRDYWSIAGKNPSVLPLLDSTLGNPGADKIDIVHLLPPNARHLLFVYPNWDMAVANDFPDCFWTAFNFLESELSDRNLDYPLDLKLGSRWLAVEPPLRLGDIILVSETESGEAIHACNYIADDLVFTKNGLSLMRPFTISSLQSMLGNYHQQGATDVRYYRHQDVLATESP